MADENPDSPENCIARSEQEGTLNETLNKYLPLVTKLPLLRNNPGMLKAEIKAESRGGVQDVVTNADLYIQEEMSKFAEKKGWQFWGEEGEKQISRLDPSRKYLLIVDPIEGTNNFLARKEDQWGSVLALIENKSGEPVIGLIAHPAKRRLYLGLKGTGSYTVEYEENGGVTSISEMQLEPEYNEFTYNNSPHFEEKLVKQVERFLSLGKISGSNDHDQLAALRKRLEIKMGNETLLFSDPESGALEAVRYRGTVYFKTSNEMAAVYVILNELGGKVTDGKGKKWHLGINTLIAARNGKDHQLLKSIYEKTLGE